MARKLRIEFEGAIYHVLNRGNYRRDLFTNAGEAQAFVGALREAEAGPTGSGRELQNRPAETPSPR